MGWFNNIVSSPLVNPVAAVTSVFKPPSAAPAAPPAAAPDMLPMPGAQPTAPATARPNPWGPQLGADQSALQQATTQLPGRMSALQGMGEKYGAGGEGGYPAMPNAYNLGQNAGPTPGTSSNPGYMTQDINKVMPESSSRGFNPWSLQGESNARGK